MTSVKLKTLTPVHIGSGRELARDVEFLQWNNEIGVIDEKKTLEIIGEENIGTWVAIIESQEPLLNYLTTIKKNLKLMDVCKYTMPLYANKYSQTRTLKEQLRNGTGKPYIPGSSIKGAIRTALLNIFLEKLQRNWREDELKNKRGNFSDKAVQSIIFGKDPNHDFMRFLKTGDALFSNDSMIVLSVLSLNYLNGQTKRDEKLLQLTETIEYDFDTEFRMKLDLDLWQKNIEFGIIRKEIPDFLKDLPSLFKVLNDFTASLLQKEIEFWEEDAEIDAVYEYIDDCQQLLEDCKNCRENEAVLRLGHGSGWLFMTGGWVKNPTFINDKGKDNLYEKIIDKTRPKNKFYKDYFFPKTRRMDEDGELLGFVKLEANI